jgi:Family of unknown function (DUF5670)
MALLREVGIDSDVVRLAAYVIVGMVAAILMLALFDWAIRRQQVDGQSVARNGDPMYSSTFLIVAVILVVAWALGGFVFHVAGGLIHILLIVAVISLVVHFLRGRP